MKHVCALTIHIMFNIIQQITRYFLIEKKTSPSFIISIFQWNSILHFDGTSGSFLTFCCNNATPCSRHYELLFELQNIKPSTKTKNTYANAHGTRDTMHSTRRNDHVPVLRAVIEGSQLIIRAIPKSAMLK